MGLSMTEVDDMVEAQLTGIGRVDPRERVYSKFFVKAVKNETKSREAGRDIYEDVAYIRIITPGDRSNIVERKARDTDKRRFAGAWKAFEAGMEAPSEGMPLGEWAAISRSQAEELKFFGIMTVEQLAETPDSSSGATMGFYSLKEKAKAWMAQSEKDAPFAKLREENENLKRELEVLRDQIAVITSEAPKRRKRAVQNSQ